MPLSHGTVIDERYRILEPIGRGGFATVYEAQHILAERKVALKVINQAPAGGGGLDKLLDEARLIAAIDHPNVVSIFDCGIISDTQRRRPYIVMERLYGHCLDTELITAGALPIHRALKLAIGALKGLSVVHQKGIIHTDLKPSNLFIQNPGTAKERIVILDFGIAVWQRDAVQHRSADGRLRGTPLYFAPEAINEAQITHSVDIYQMGLILVEMLTGKPVVNRASLYQCLLEHMSGDLAIPIGLLTSPLGPLVCQVLALNPEERLKTAGQFAQRLEQLAEHITRVPESWRFVVPRLVQPESLEGSRRSLDPVDVPIEVEEPEPPPSPPEVADTSSSQDSAQPMALTKNALPYAPTRAMEKQSPNPPEHQLVRWLRSTDDWRSTMHQLLSYGVLLLSDVDIAMLGDRRDIGIAFKNAEGKEICSAPGNIEQRSGYGHLVISFEEEVLSTVLTALGGAIALARFEKSS